jgi:hypothetical protein
MVVLEHSEFYKHTCLCCKSKLGYTKKDIYTKEFCDPERVYKRFHYFGPVRKIDFSKEWITVFFIKCPVCGKEIELSSTPSKRTRE